MGYSVEYHREWRANNPDKTREAYRRYANKPENKERRKAYDAARYDIRREQHLNRRYGITTDQFNQLLVDQKNKCAVCDEVLDGRIHVDHNHITGKVRGLLCAGCNHGLGYIEKPNWLEKALEYLEHDNE